MSLDITTLFIALGLINFFLAAILLLFWKTQKTYDGFQFWIAAQVILTIAYFLLMLRGRINDFFSIVIANPLFAAAAMLMLYGVNRFFGIRKNFLPALIIPLIVFLLFCCFLYIDNSFLIRNTIAAALNFIIGLIIVINIFKHLPEKNRIIFLLTAALMIIHTVLSIVRGHFVYTQNPVNLLDNGLWNTSYFLFLMIFYSGLNMTFIMWNHSRMSGELASSNDELIRALMEKETLLNELDHRTKNNLQIIISMINIKRVSIKEENTRNVLSDLSTRVQTLSLVYQKLSAKQSLQSIPVDEYIVELSSLIITAFRRESTIRLETDLEHINFKIDNAVSIGIVLNEIITNAVKHAFSENEIGTISLHLKKTADGKLLLSVSDNGKGFPEGFRAEESPSYGLKIVQSIIRDQLEGSIELVRNKGTQWNIILSGDL